MIQDKAHAAPRGGPIDVPVEGTYFGKYKVLRRIGTGGMAEIFKCQLSGIGGFDKILVVKRMIPDLLDDVEFVRMFLDEARISANLSHPNIIQIYEIDQIDQIPYIAMEYVRGPTLARLVREEEKQKKPSPQIIARVMSEICGALHYAHNATDPQGQPLGIIHRDVSPHNILISTEGVPKLLDFGVAKARGRLQKTNAGTIKGKLRYMSPEQFRGGQIDQRVDVFGVGVCLYQAVTGKHAYGGESEVDVLKAAAGGEFIAPSKVNPEIDPELERIILWAMAPDPTDRCPNAHELQDALEKYAASGPLQVNTYQVKKHLRVLFGDLDNSDVIGIGSYSGEPISSRRFGSSSEREKLLEKPAPRPPAPPGENGRVEHPASFSLKVDIATERRKLPRAKTLWLGAAGVVLALGAGVGLSRLRREPAPGPAPVAAPAPAAAFLDEAQTLLKEGRPKAARALLARAREAGALPPVLENRAARLEDVLESGRLVEEGRRALEQGDRATAARLAREALERDATHPAANALLTQAQAKPPPAAAPAATAPGRLTVATEPPSARLWLDGKPLALGATSRLPVPAGPHTVRALARGYTPQERTVQVPSGEELRVSLRLAREPDARNARPAPAPTPPPVAAPAPELERHPDPAPSVAAVEPPPAPVEARAPEPLPLPPAKAPAAAATAEPEKAAPAELEGPISSCPEGAQLAGAAPPRGSSLWCELAGGVRHGKFLRWYPNGQQAEQGEYRQGKKNGRWIEFYENGSERERTEWRRGVKSW